LQNERIDRWIQLATAVAVVVGIALVVWELQQTRVLTFAQVAHGNMDELSQERAGLYGENLGEVLAVACHTPGKLTEAQAFVLDAYFDNQVLRVVRYWVEVEAAGFSTDWRFLGRRHIVRILGFPQGRSWMEGRFLNGSPYAEISSFVEELSRGEIPSCVQTTQRLIPERVPNDV
jgi:hypothetical protein